MKFLRANAPTLPESLVRQIAREQFTLTGESKPLYSERDQNTLFREADGSAWMLKVANRDEDPEAIDCQVAVLGHIRRVDARMPVPRVRMAANGQACVRVTAPDGTGHVAYALSYIDGHVAGDRDLDAALIRRIGAMQARLGRAMRGFFHPAAGRRALLWDARMAPEYLQHLGVLPEAPRAIAEAILRRAIDDVLPRLESLRAQAIHGDLHAYNLILSESADIAGIIDFGDMIHGALVCDVAAALADFMTSVDRIAPVLGQFIAGYQSVTLLEDAERELLFDLVQLRLVMGQIVNAYRRTQTPDEPNYAADVGFGGSSVIEALRRMGADGFEALVAGVTTAVAGSAEPILSRRSRLLGSKAYLFYERPIHAVRGEGVWIIDDAGRRYLDCYNNVPIVGHCHARVADAIARQCRILNTNTRYLGEQVLAYAEQLGARAGAGLTACAFVNSGSEANDVAWRMATAWTGARGALAQEFAYHGITEAIDAISPSASRTGVLAGHVRTLLAPDGYRGIYRSGTPDIARHYAQDADRAIDSLAEAGLKPAAYFVDSAFMTNGMLEPLPGYVADVFRRVRAAGGLCVADEVQSGFGRMGRHFFGYQHHDVVPDIITIGKPAGNGHPLGVVITRPEILEHFMDQTNFFSTFGGNNVSCAAGLAVLAVLEDEGLVANAAAVGAHFKAGLKALMARHELIGDVRGTGLAVGVELVTDRAKRTPAPQHTARMINRMRDEGVLTGSEGVHGNIIKMRPPLVATREHMDIALAAFERSIAAL